MRSLNVDTGLLLQKKSKQYGQKLFPFLDNDIYLIERFNLKTFSLAIIESESNNIFDHLPTRLRKSDVMIFLESTVIAVLYRFTPLQEGGFKACENLLNSLEKYANSEICIGVTEYNHTVHTPHSLILKTLVCLDHAKAAGTSTIVVE